MALLYIRNSDIRIDIASSDVQVKYGPFLVKEEKLLLQALESQDSKEITKALKEIVQACTLVI